MTRMMRQAAKKRKNNWTSVKSKEVPTRNNERVKGMHSERKKKICTWKNIKKEKIRTLNL